jgi:hypothetical protein
MNLYDALSVVLLPLSLGLAGTTLPEQWSALRSAREFDERIYWMLTMVGHTILALGLFLSAFWMLDRLTDDPLGMNTWWPSPTRFLGGSDWNGHAALLDVLCTLVGGLLPILLASYFGYRDEDGNWCRPYWRQTVQGEHVVQLSRARKKKEKN